MTCSTFSSTPNRPSPAGCARLCPSVMYTSCSGGIVRTVREERGVPTSARRSDARVHASVLSEVAACRTVSAAPFATATAAPTSTGRSGPAACVKARSISSWRRQPADQKVNPRAGPKRPLTPAIARIGP